MIDNTSLLNLLINNYSLIIIPIIVSILTNIVIFFSKAFIEKFDIYNKISDKVCTIGKVRQVYIIENNKGKKLYSLNVQLLNKSDKSIFISSMGIYGEDKQGISVGEFYSSKVVPHHDSIDIGIFNMSGLSEKINDNIDNYRNNKLKLIAFDTLGRKYSTNIDNRLRDELIDYKNVLNNKIYSY